MRRLPKRGAFDRETVYAILDEAFICHIGFIVDGQPYVIPTAFGRVGDHSLYSRLVREPHAANALDGIDICFTVTLIDALVLARSAFHHSINYRSVVVLGNATLVEDADEKITALEAITNHIVPGRWDDVRWPNELELKATSVLNFRSKKRRPRSASGHPIDDEEDYAMDIWAGLLPFDENRRTDRRRPAGKWTRTARQHQTLHSKILNFGPWRIIATDFRPFSLT